MKKYLLSGLALLLPLTITILIIVFFLNLLTHPFINLIKSWLNYTYESQNHWVHKINHHVLFYIAQFLILLGLFLFTTFIGFIARLFFIRYIIKLTDTCLAKLPIVNKIYKTSKEIIKVLFSPDTAAFKKVVMAPFPYSDNYCIGLVSGVPPKACQKLHDKKLVTVLVPTAPHPISGYLLLYKEEDLIYLDVSVEDAVKFTVSCGIIHPKERLEELIK